MAVNTVLNVVPDPFSASNVYAQKLLIISMVDQKIPLLGNIPGS
jgi:hypothetical protein